MTKEMHAAQARIPEQYRQAEVLERALGDPRDPHSDFSFARAVSLDEREEYPESACALLDAWGFTDFYVPTVWGGRLESYEEFISLLRVVARRNLTVVVAHTKTYLGAAAVWACGSRGQRERLSEIIRGGGQVALAYHEKAHGSDLLSTEVEARIVEGGYLLDGEKWLVNNATRGAAMTLFAKTSERGGPRGFSLFLVEKSRLAPGSYEHLPAVKTLGVRGADFSGIRFKGCFVGGDALVGEEGAGLEQTLKAFQLTRTIIAGLSLGAADTALNVTLDFARSRRLYDRHASDLPHLRRRLTASFARLLTAECLTLAAARALHQTPAQMRLYSAAAKFFAATEVEALVEGLAAVLGARHYLREEHADGVFQKLLRDQRVLSIFHAGTFLNLTTVGIHLRDLAQARQRPADEAERDRLRQRVRAISDLAHPLAPLDPSALRLYTRGRDDLLHSLDLALEELRALPPTTVAAPHLIALLTAQVARLLEARAALDRSQREAEQRLGLAYGRSPEMFAQAERYCLLLAAACSLHLWLHSRDGLGGFFAEGEWLALALGQTLRRMGMRESGVAPSVRYEQRVWEQMIELHDERRLLSIVPVQLARSDAQGPDSAGDVAGRSLVASEVRCA